MTAERSSVQDGKVTLLLQIRAATRVDHAVLNKAIFARFPDCIPPKASSAYLYAAGMSVFGQIYHALEESWNGLLTGLDSSEKDAARYHEMLTQLQTPLLPRSDRIKSDLEFIEKKMLPAEAGPFLTEIREKSRVFNDRVSHAIRANPPVILAYARIMYLALFNGGRRMVESLVAAGEQLWLERRNIDAYSGDVLSFWFFDDGSPRDNRQHGESVKEEFCRRFDHAAEMMSAEEEKMVVEESRRVLRMCVEMIEFIDGLGLERQIEIMDGKTTRDRGSQVTGYLAWLALPVVKVWSSLLGKSVG